MTRTSINYFCIAACLMLLLVPALAHADFTVTNSLIEVGVNAGDNSDGFGAHGLNEIFLSVSDNGPEPGDFQQADGLFVLGVEEDTVLGDYELTYESQVFAITGGIGDASALANGIIVFNLSEEFQAVSHLGETVLSDSLGGSVLLTQDDPLLLSAGTYSLSFGTSAFIHDGDTQIEFFDSISGVVSFNRTSVPEPAVPTILFLLAGFAVRRKR